jgi:excinuclease ABC subunit C
VRALSKVALLRPPTSDEQLAVMRAHVRDAAVDRPGVYRMIASDGEIVYVGKSKRVRSRLLSYFRGEFPEDKGARILRDASSIEWEYVPSEFAALLAELRLIKRFRPRFNVAMKRDGRNYCFIKVAKSPAPKLVVVRGPGQDDSAVYYGPFLGAVGVGDAVRELNDVLGLRDCAADQPMHFADQPELFDSFPRTPGCIRFEVKKCLGPCVGGCSVRQYGERLGLAMRFLDGEDDGPIERLRGEMEAASGRLEYERAAAFRDKLKRLEALRGQFARLRFAVETLSFVYTVPGYDGADRVYLIRRGRVRAETEVPRVPGDAATLMNLITDVFDPGERDSVQIPTHEIDELLLLSAWFRRFPEELERTSASPRTAARVAAFAEAS